MFSLPTGVGLFFGDSSRRIQSVHKGIVIGVLIGIHVGSPVCLASVIGNRGIRTARNDVMKLILQIVAILPLD